MSARWREALELIAGDVHCMTFTHGSCRDEYSGRCRDPVYGAEQWCDVCIARDALEAEPPPQTIIADPVSECTFCRIVRGEEPAEIVHEWATALAIVPLNPVSNGHVLVIPKKHVRDALSDPEVAAMTMKRAALLAAAPCNIITSVGVEATQSVFHLHLHVVPRRKGDGLLLPWTQEDDHA